MDYKEYDNKYANLLVNKCFVNDGNKPLVIRIKWDDQIPFAKLVYEKAKEAGFKEVYILNCNYDKLIDYLRKTNIDDIKLLPEFDRSIALEYAKKEANFLYLESERPKYYTREESKKLDKYYDLIDKELEDYYACINNLTCPWTLACYPNKEWAKEVYPNLSINKAYEKLYLNIMKMCLCDKDNPLEEWKKIQDRQHDMIEKLNDLRIERLHYQSEIGTDLTLELPTNHLWMGASDDKDYYGNKIMVNMPSYEIFTAPIYTSTNGIVYSTTPLCHNRIIKNFGLEFKDGEVKNIIAKNKEDYEALKDLTMEDDGSRFLGECALVESDTPVGKTNSLYYEPLYDENSSSHLALGNSYSDSIVNGLMMDEDELRANGLNLSNTHVDFMIGSPDLNIMADTNKGKKLIFTKGKFNI